jgi:hypothetical protein
VNVNGALRIQDAKCAARANRKNFILKIKNTVPEARAAFSSRALRI